MSFLNASPFAGLSILPVLVFLAETCVVTLSTIRTICITRGWKRLAATIGFFEVSIWLFAIGQIMQNLTNIGCYLAFASGFSLGNYLGVIIEQKLAFGTVVVQITTNHNAADLVQSLKAANYGVTMLDAQGATGPVRVVFTVIKRKQLPEVVCIIKSFDQRAFYAVNDLQSAAEGIFPKAEKRSPGAVPSFMRLLPGASSDQDAAAEPAYLSRRPLPSTAATE